VDERLSGLINAQDGVVLRRQALDAGLDSEDFRELLRGRALVRLRRGAYTTSELWADLDDAGRHILCCRAVLLALDRPAVLSHTSAAAVLGLPLWDVDLTTVHVTRADLHSARLESGVEHHSAQLDEDQIVQAHGMYVTRPARTVVDVARECGFESGVVTADAALHAGLIDRDELLRTHGEMAHWRGARVAGRVLSFADGRSESVGESRARVCFATVGLPKPELQYKVTLDTGKDAFLDFYFVAERTGGEFDGQLKYRVPPRAGQAAVEQVLWRERQREEAIRRAGHELCRLVWSDLGHPMRVRERFLNAFAAARRRGLTRSSA
jgi:hypothetical protein